GQRVLGIGGQDVPRALGELALQLTGPPARVAGEYAQPVDARSRLAGLSAQVQNAETVDDGFEARHLRPRSGPRQTDGGVRLHRPADEDQRRMGRFAAPVGERPGELGVGRPVEHNAGSAFVRVLDDQYYRPEEVRVQ